MFKKVVLSTAICLGLFLSMQQNCLAQEKTKDELKAEREVLKSEMNSKKAQARIVKFEKLIEQKDKHVNTTVESLDQLAETSVVLLLATKNVSALVPEMYKRTIGESIDGIADVNVKKPTLVELLDLSKIIAAQVITVIDAAEIIPQVSSDIKTMSPMQIPKAMKSLNFSKDVLSLLGPELQLNLKVIINLIATLKSADNL